MDIAYQNGISVEDYHALRAAVGWEPLCDEQARRSLEHTAFLVRCRDGGTTAGMARLVWDGGYVAYLSDVMVQPEYQGRGIGSELVRRCVEFLRAQLKPGWRIKIFLVAAEGKEPFYEQFGFRTRPNPGNGAGMDLVLYGK